MEDSDSSSNAHSDVINSSSEEDDELESSFSGDSDYEPSVSSEEEVTDEDPGIAKYPLHELTQAHLHEHNCRFSKYAVWQKDFNVVYDAKRVYCKMLPVLRDRCNELGFDSKDIVTILRDIKYNLPRYKIKLHIQRKLQFSDEDLSRARLECRVGEMKVKSAEETRLELRNGIQQTRLGILYLKNDCNIYPPIIEYLDAFSDLCKGVLDQIDNCIQNPPCVNDGDPNRAEFTLPTWFHLDTIRPYLRTYIPSSTKLETEHLYRTRVFPVLCEQECLAIFGNSLRPSINENSELDTSLDACGAWEVMEQSVIANDIPSQKQLLVLEARKRILRPPTEQEMETRRSKLLDYFGRYYQDKTKIEKYKSWADAMALSQSRFQELLS